MAYVPITALPAPPSRQDPTNFADEADAFLGAFPTLRTEINTSGVYFDAQATVATAQAGVATTQAGLSADQVPLAANQVTLATAQVALAADEVVLAANQVTLATAQVALAADEVVLAAGQVTLATTQAGIAANSAATAGGVAWVSGTNYGVGSVVYSGINYQNYRAIQTTSGTTDPRNNASDWVSLSGSTFTTGKAIAMAIVFG